MHNRLVAQIFVRIFFESRFCGKGWVMKYSRAEILMMDALVKGTVYQDGFIRPQY